MAVSWPRDFSPSGGGVWSFLIGVPMKRMNRVSGPTQVIGASEDTSPTTWAGIDGKIADTFNVVAANQTMAKELKRVGQERSLPHTRGG